MGDASIKHLQGLSSERTTICFPHHGSEGVLHQGDPGFMLEQERLYRSVESSAIEQILALKTTLRSLPTDKFWPAVTEGLSQCFDADITFVMKRVLVDDQDTTVEMPPIGEPGSCVMAAALHYNPHDGSEPSTVIDTKFHSYNCPCAYMRHDKVFLIADRLDDFIHDNPNALPTPCEAYMAVPIFAQGKCVAHFGLMWSSVRAPRRQLSWALIEMMLHSLEDMITQRLLEGGTGSAQSLTCDTQAECLRVIPHEDVSESQSLRPYAGSLSHELRTPMQGIVGMLDIMHATVQEAVESRTDASAREIFENLRESIEVVQDSSRRAIEAADNVVHAYDMDMSMPEVSVSIRDDADHSVAASAQQSPLTSDRRPEILVAGSNLPLSRPNKRRREESFSTESELANKMPRLSRETSATCHCPSSGPSNSLQPPQPQSPSGHRRSRSRRQGNLPNHDASTPVTTRANTAPDSRSHPADAASDLPNRVIAPGLRHTSLRELLQHVVDEGLKFGGRPDAAFSTLTEHGEIVEVRIRRSDGTMGQKLIEWSIAPDVPHTLFVDEKDLGKLISCLFLNSMKFTDNVNGRINIRIDMKDRSKYISVRVSDNGPGILSAFLPRLFKPFSQENASLTRSSDGLGLGLMVAKGIARKLGGDLTCTHTDTESPNHGTEFEMKIPLQFGEIISRPVSPFGSPLPRRAQIATPVPAAPLHAEHPHPLPFPNRPPSPRSKPGEDMSHAGRAPPLFRTPQHHAPANLPSPDSEADALPSSIPSPLSSPAITAEVGPQHVLDHLSTVISQPAARTDPAPTSAVSSVIAPQPPPPALPTNLFRDPVQFRTRNSVVTPQIDRDLARKYPLTFLVAEDNKINRKLLVNMLQKFGYAHVLEAHDGVEAVRQMQLAQQKGVRIDVVLMDLWMPLMDGYEATTRILDIARQASVELATCAVGGPESLVTTPSETNPAGPTVLAVTADVTDGALERAANVGMRGFMTKPFKLMDLQRLITEYCTSEFPRESRSAHATTQEYKLGSAASTPAMLAEHHRTAGIPA